MSSGLNGNQRTWPFGLFIGLLVTFHFLLSIGFGFAQYAPDLAVAALLLGARRLRGSFAALLGLGIGLLKDAVSLAAFGAAAVVLTLTGFLGARSRDIFLGEGAIFTLTYLFVGKWFADAAYLLFAGGALRLQAASWLFVQAPLAALVTASAGALALGSYRWLAGER